MMSWCITPVSLTCRAGAVMVKAEIIPIFTVIKAPTVPS